jgi:hypothetical protein
MAASSMTHVLLRAQVFHPSLINHFPPYEPGGALAHMPRTRERDGRLFVSTPQARCGRSVAVV